MYGYIVITKKLSKQREKFSKKQSEIKNCSSYNKIEYSKTKIFALKCHPIKN